LPKEGLDAAADTGRVRHWGKNQQLFEQGQVGVRAHILLSGSVRISQGGSDGGLVIMRFIRPGEMFGAVSLFTDGRYPAEATCVTDCTEVSWGEAELTELIRRYPTIATNMIRVIGLRLQETQERVRELSTQRAEQRVANAVLRLARQSGHAAFDGTAIEFPLRRKDVADISGTTLHTASRILTAWEKAGLMTSRNRKLTLCRPEELIRISEDLAQ
jgi:CRP-like cAMP-binding protein